MRHFIIALWLITGLCGLPHNPSRWITRQWATISLERQIPDAPVRVYVGWRGGDQSRRIQQAIDAVARMKPDKASGLRGAVLLAPGTYRLSQPLRIAASGVVLRGSGRRATAAAQGGCRPRVCGLCGGAARPPAHRHGLHPRAGDVPPGATTLPAVTSAPRFSGWATRWWCAGPSTKLADHAHGCASWKGGEGELGYWGWHPGEIDGSGRAGSLPCRRAGRRRRRAVDGAAPCRCRYHPAA